MAVPKKRGRAAALEQLAEKHMGSADGGAGLLSPPRGGDGLFPQFVTGGAVSSTGVPVDRMTFAERVGDIRDNVERARAEYRSRAKGALGGLPSAGPSTVTTSMHQKFADLEVAWGAVMDFASIDPLSTGTPGLNAASAALSRNRHGLDEEVNAVLVDLWDGVSGGQTRAMSGTMKDEMVQQLLAAPGCFSPGRRQMDMASHQDRQIEGYPQSSNLDTTLPLAGTQDVQTRRQLEQVREEILRLEKSVLQAVDAEEAALPPPPPLICKRPNSMPSLKKAAAYEEIASRMKTAVVGVDGDCGGTPMTCSDDPNIRMMMPPKDGMKITQQLDALQKECSELRAVTAQEVGHALCTRHIHGSI